MHTYLRNKPAWLQLMIFGGLTFGLLVVTLWVSVSIVAKLNHMSFLQVSTLTPKDFASPEYAGIVKGLLIANSLGSFLLPALVFSYLADPHPMSYLGIKSPQRNTFLLIGVITMIAGFFAVEMLGPLNESIVYHLPKSIQRWILRFETETDLEMKNIMTMKGPFDLVLMLLLAGALPAICEEFFFRGVLQKLFIQIFKAPWPGIIFTALIFSAFHMQFMGFIPRMALGIILGALYWYSGSILTSMLGHFVFNSIGVFMIYYKVADLDSGSNISPGYILIGIASLVMIVFLLSYLKKYSTTSYAVEFPPAKEYNIFDEPDERA